MKQKPKTKKTNASAPPSHRNKLPDLQERKRKWTLALLVGILGFLLYSNTFTHGYVLDDFSAVKENNIVRQGISAIPELFKTSYRQGYLSVKDGLYRPLVMATYAIEWDFFPDRPGVSHFVNVVLYGLTGILLFFALTLFTGKDNERWGETVAFIASLLFITHPLHAEVTANIKSRDEMMSFLFVLCGFICTFRYFKGGGTKFLLFGIGSYFLSLLSKETSITFLVLLPLAVHFFTAVPLRKNIATTAFFVGTAAVYLLIRNKVLGGAMADDSTSMADNLIVGAKTFSTHMGTAFFILGSYVKLHFFPHPLSYDYSYNQIPIVELGNLFSILSVLFYFAIGLYAALILLRSFSKKQEAPVTLPSKYISFGIFFFLITIFLFSNLVLIIGTSMGDRLMYYPSLGFCIVIAVLLVKILKLGPIGVKRPFSNLKLAPVAAILLLFSIKTYSRNADWKDNYTLYAHDVNLVPNSVKAHYYLGLELIKTVADAEPDPEKKKKFYAEGISELEKAVKILPYFSSAYTQMGVAYYRLKNYENAIENYNKAASYRPSDAITLNNIGTVYFEWKKYPEAAAKFREAIAVDERFVDAHMNLGSVLGMMQDYNNAIASFQNALRYAPDNANAYYFIALTYANMKDATNADTYFQRAEQLNPKLKRPPPAP